MGRSQGCYVRGPPEEDGYWCSCQRSHQQGANWLLSSHLWLHPHPGVHTGPFHMSHLARPRLKVIFTRSHRSPNVRCHVGDYMRVLVRVCVCVCVCVCVGGRGDVVVSQGTFPGPCTPFRFSPGRPCVRVDDRVVCHWKLFYFSQKYFFYLYGLFTAHP